MLASKRAEVASTRVSRTLELEGVLNSFRSAMKGEANYLRYNGTPSRRKLGFVFPADDEVPTTEVEISSNARSAHATYSRFGSRLSLMHELVVKAAMPHRFVEISTRLTVQRRQPAVRGNQTGEHAETSLECEHGTLTMP